MVKSKVWKYCENRDLVFTTKYHVGHFVNEWLELDGHIITVYGSHLKGYAWDGCSPKTRFLDLYLGTPDGIVTKQYVEVKEDSPRGQWPQFDYVPKTYYASLVHDLLYQFKKEVPVSREVADLIFLEFMEAQGFILAGFYYRAVRAVGWIYGKWLTK